MEYRKLEEIIQFNPTETIKKGTISKKISMDKLDNFKKYVNSFDLEEYKGGAKFKNGDTLFARITPCLENGKTAKVSILGENEIGFGSTEYIVMRKRNNISDEDFIYYLAISPEFRNIAIKSMTGTSGRQRVQLDVLKNTEMLLPSYEEQKKIGKILSSLDEKIELNNKINNNLYEIGRAYFENYLESCKEEIRIKEVANEILDYHKSKEKKVKLINSSDITENNFPEFEFVDNCNLKGHFKKRFRKYDILYSQIRPRNHHFGYVLFENTEEYIASTRLMVVRAKEEKISSSLLYYYLTSKEAIEDFTTKTETRSGTFPQGNYGDLSSFKIKYNKNQENITNVLNIVLNRIYSNQIKTKNLEKIRDALLPKLMNGEIDLDKIEI